MVNWTKHAAEPEHRMAGFDECNAVWEYDGPAGLITGFEVFGETGGETTRGGAERREGESTVEVVLRDGQFRIDSVVIGGCVEELCEAEVQRDSDVFFGLVDVHDDGSSNSRHRAPTPYGRELSLYERCTFYRVRPYTSVQVILQLEPRLTIAGDR
jgi:hypothetical protein